MSASDRFLDELASRVLVGDGALGTELLARGAPPDTGIERLNLLAPDLVAGLHRDYVAAGSRVIETNTFAASRPHLARHDAADDCRAIILAGAHLARDAAGPDAYVAGSVGPLPPVDGEPLGPDGQEGAFREVIGALLDGGVDLLLFETFTDLDDLERAVRLARSLTTIPVIGQMAFEASGRSVGGVPAPVVAERVLAAGADVVGANCGEGVPSVIAGVRGMAGGDRLISAYMNAGFAERVENRRMYLATPRYLAERAVQLAGLGVRLVGGCCGTDPTVIREIAAALSSGYVTVAVPAQKTSVAPRAVTVPESGPCEGVCVPTGILVELDPPKGLDIDPLVAAASELAAAGADAITVADNPMASVRVDVLATAGIIARGALIPVIPHLTGRDRNRIALQSTIMAAHVTGIRSLLCVTGDPVRMYHETNTSGVFDVTSIGLVKLVAEFNEGLRTGDGSRTSFAIGVAFNPNTTALDTQIARLARKVEAGAHFALTQPVFDIERFDRLTEALDAAHITIPVFIGVLPLVSARNAEFLHNEVPGMTIPAVIRERLAGYSAVADQRAAGVEMAVSLVEGLAGRARGFYFIAPRNRASAVVPLVKAARTPPKGA